MAKSYKTPIKSYKTLIQWMEFYGIDAEIVEKAKIEIEARGARPGFYGFSSTALSCAFFWGDTVDGYDYWKGVYDLLIEAEKRARVS